MVMQPSFHPADGITHGAVIAQIKFLTYFFQTLAANIPQKIDGKVTRLVFHTPPGLQRLSIADLKRSVKVVPPETKQPSGRLKWPHALIFPGHRSVS